MILRILWNKSNPCKYQLIYFEILRNLIVEFIEILINGGIKIVTYDPHFLELNPHYDFKICKTIPFLEEPELFKRASKHVAFVF